MGMARAQKTKRQGMSANINSVCNVNNCAQAILSMLSLLIDNHIRKNLYPYEPSKHPPFLVVQTAMACPSARPLSPRFLPAQTRLPSSLEVLPVPPGLFHRLPQGYLQEFSIQNFSLQQTLQYHRPIHQKYRTLKNFLLVCRCFVLRQINYVNTVVILFAC